MPHTAGRSISDTATRTGTVPTGRVPYSTVQPVEICRKRNVPVESMEDGREVSRSVPSSWPAGVQREQNTVRVQRALFACELCEREHAKRENRESQKFLSRCSRARALFSQRWAACACGYRPISRDRSRSAATSHTTLTTSSAPVPSCCAKGITCTQPQEDPAAVPYQPSRGCRRSMPPALRMPARPHHHKGFHSRPCSSTTAPEPCRRSKPSSEDHSSFRNHSTPEQVLRQPRC